MRRDSLYAWLAADPRLQCRKPDGAFYMFVDIGDTLSVDGLRTSGDFAQALLDEARVAVTPGEAFDAPGFVTNFLCHVDGEPARGQPALVRVRGCALPRRSGRRLAS